MTKKRVRNLLDDAVHIQSFGGPAKMQRSFVERVFDGLVAELGKQLSKAHRREAIIRNLQDELSRSAADNLKLGNRVRYLEIEAERRREVLTNLRKELTNAQRTIHRMRPPADGLIPTVTAKRGGIEYATGGIVSPNSLPLVGEGEGCVIVAPGGWREGQRVVVGEGRTSTDSEINELTKTVIEETDARIGTPYENVWADMAVEQMAQPVQADTMSRLTDALLDAAAKPIEETAPTLVADAAWCAAVEPIISAMTEDEKPVFVGVDPGNPEAMSVVVMTVDKLRELQTENKRLRRELAEAKRAAAEHALAPQPGAPDGQIVIQVEGYPEGMTVKDFGFYERGFNAGRRASAIRG